MDDRQGPAPEEIEPKADGGRRSRCRGRLLFAAVIGLIVYGLYRYLISLGNAGSFSF